jgi:hypothetical protein
MRVNLGSIVVPMLCWSPHHFELACELHFVLTKIYRKFPSKNEQVRDISSMLYNIWNSPLCTLYPCKFVNHL